MPQFRKLRLDKRVVAANLREALQTRGWNPRTLAGALEDVMPGARGTSYASMRALIAAKIANPRTEVLKAIAEVLGVRAEWLICSNGEMTTKRQRVVDLDIQAGDNPSVRLNAKDVLKSLGLRYPLVDAAQGYFLDCEAALPDQEEQFRQVVRDLFAGSFALRDSGVPHAEFVAAFYTELSALYLRTYALQRSRNHAA